MTDTGLPNTREEVLLVLLNRKEPQALVGESCTYDHNVNGGCAIGQCLTSKQARNMPGYGLYDEKDFNALPGRMKTLDQDFLWKIQKIHDYQINWFNYRTAEKDHDTGYVWNKGGLNQIRKIISEYNLNIKL